MRRLMKRMVLAAFVGLMGFAGIVSCSPEPPLHLYDASEVTMDVPMIDLDLQVYWDYEMAFGIDYDWQAEWFYGWDDDDKALWGEIGYNTPTLFQLRRYFTGEKARAPHTAVIAAEVEGNHFQGRYDWGFWDILCWNRVHTLDGVQSLLFDESTTLDSVTAYTNQTMRATRYNAPRYTHAFNAPEPLFAAYEQAIEINKSLDGFVYDEERDVYVKKLNMVLMPVTYIYLTQVILHHNRGRVTGIDGTASLSGMARSTTLNSGRAGEDAITVDYRTRMKQDCEMKDERVDIVGGRLLTFGICSLKANKVSRGSTPLDPNKHYMDVNFQFLNGMDSTMVFDVTEQVKRRYKGGVITVELDMDTIPIPTRSGGSGFDAVVKEVEDGGTYEFEM